MLGVTVIAVGGVFIVGGHRFAVQTVLIDLLNLVMTVAAIDGSKRMRVLVTRNVGVFMTGEAAVFSMHRLFEFLLVDE